MFEGHDQLELLALIEDELDPAKRAALTAKLAADPRAMRLIERLREDRTLLRGAGEPVMPGDLLADLEPMLARPMLMESPAPGTELRRRMRTRALARQVGAALAAMLAIAAGIGVWMNWPGGGAAPVVQDGERLVGRPMGDGLIIPEAPVVDDEPWPPVEGTIHHRLPMNSENAMMAAAQPPQTPVSSGTEPTVVAIVIESRDEAAVLAALSRIMPGLGGDAALVKNLTYDEASRLEQAVVAQARTGQDEPLAASVETAGRSGKRYGRQGLIGKFDPVFLDAPAVKHESGLISGRRDVAATLGEQLAFSQHGAALTLSLPAQRLADVLEEMAGVSARLTVLDGSEDGAESQAMPSSESQWLAQMRELQQAAREIREAREAGGVIHVPIIVKAREKK